eukprot:gene1072-2100_t
MNTSLLFAAFILANFMMILQVSAATFKVARRTTLSPRCSWRCSNFAVSMTSRSFTAYSIRSGLDMSSESLPVPGWTEMILTNIPDDSLLKKLASTRSIVVNKISESVNGQKNQAYWTVHSGGLQLDGTFLEPYFLGGKPLSDEETIEQWKSTIENRLQIIKKMKLPGGFVNPTQVYLNDEVNAGIAAVTKASQMSRSIQRNLISRGGVLKEDKSPVTIADFAVQTLIINDILSLFPDDKFIAEEDSQVLRSDPAVREGVLSALRAATGEQWTENRLYETIDRGTFNGSSSSSSSGERVWVLDPVDGTKGFMRGQHYCVALALLVGGRPQLSVLGCPNLTLKRVMESTILSNITEIANIDPLLELSTSIDGVSHVHNPEAGSVFFAVSGEGAFARSLSMPVGAAFEVQISQQRDVTAAVLCESYETTYGDRDTTAAVARELAIKKDFLRLDGQCKYAVVGAGAAESNLRLPKGGYREKIWDHAPGSHFVSEAGGKVTDLAGKPIDFGQGRLLGSEVAGIIASNGHLHNQILQQVNLARNS